MLPFFDGWRRRLGCITLMLVCVCVFWWVRSLFVTDVIRLRERNKSLNAIALDHTSIFDSDYVNVFASNGSSVLWLRRRDRDHTEPPFETYPATGDVLERMVPQADLSHPAIVSIPYPVIVFPLTMLAAYLMFGKQRKSKSDTTAAGQSQEATNRGQRQTAVGLGVDGTIDPRSPRDPP